MSQVVHKVSVMKGEMMTSDDGRVLNQEVNTYRSKSQDEATMVE